MRIIRSSIVAFARRGELLVDGQSISIPLHLIKHVVPANQLADDHPAKANLTARRLLAARRAS